MRRSLIYFALLVIVISCSTPPEPEYLDCPSGGIDRNFSISSPMFCLNFQDDGYSAYIFEKDKDRKYISAYYYPPEILYDVVCSDSNKVYCRLKPEYQDTEFHLSYRNKRTNTGEWGNETDDKDYISGYCRLDFYPAHTCREYIRINERPQYSSLDSAWQALYSGPLSEYYSSRVTYKRNRDKPLKVRWIELQSDLGVLLERIRKPYQDIPDVIRANNFQIVEPLLYLPFPLGSSAYIFERRNLEKFSEDSFYCGKQNFYALYYELPSEPELLCRIISYDSNGVLAEMLPESNETDYILTLIPESGSVARAHLLNSESFVRRLHMRSLPADSVWSEVRASDHGHVPLPDYDPQVFINAYPLVDAYAKTMEK